LPKRSKRDEHFLEATRELFEDFKEKLRQEGRQEGETRGVYRGLQPLQHQSARRLGRPLTEAEAATLLGRFDTVGPDRLGDVVLDRTPDALAAWLGEPDAR
jgi:hypothetical protein